MDFKGRVVGAAVDTFAVALDTLWKGKIFYRDQGIARTLIEGLTPLRPLVDDPDTVMTVAVPRSGALRYVLPDTKYWLLFPAKVYCGQSLLDGRRESIIIDYNFGEDIEGYRASPDSLVGRGALRLRDEVRMVRPGFYLGRAYAGGMFLLNFVLYDETLAERDRGAFSAGQPLVETCWAGEQARGRAAP